MMIELDHDLLSLCQWRAPLDKSLLLAISLPTSKRRLKAEN